MAKRTTIKNCTFLLTEAGEGDWKYLKETEHFTYLLFGREGSDIIGYAECKNPGFYLKRIFWRARIDTGIKVAEIERKIKTLEHVEKGNKTDKVCSKCKQVIREKTDKTNRAAETLAVGEVARFQLEVGGKTCVTSQVRVLDTSPK